MSDLPPESSPSVSFEDMCKRTNWLLSDAERELGKIFDDDSHDMSVQMVAAQAANGLNAVMMLLALVEALGRRVKGMNAEWRDTVMPLIESANLDDATRADMLERIEQLEYATVAEGQLERIMERLTGDLADRMAGKLRGEDDS